MKEIGDQLHGKASSLSVACPLISCKLCWDGEQQRSRTTLFKTSMMTSWIFLLVVSLVRNNLWDFAIRWKRCFEKWNFVWTENFDSVQNCNEKYDLLLIRQLCFLYFDERLKSGLNASLYMASIIAQEWLIPCCLPTASCYRRIAFSFPVPRSFKMFCIYFKTKLSEVQLRSWRSNNFAASVWIRYLVEMNEGRHMLQEIIDKNRCSRLLRDFSTQIVFSAFFFVAMQETSTEWWHFYSFQKELRARTCWNLTSNILAAYFPMP